MAPELLKFEGEYKSKVSVVRVDVRNPNSQPYKDYFKLFDSQYVPHTVIVDANKKVLAKKTGVMTKDDIVKFVSPYIK